MRQLMFLECNLNEKRNIYDNYGLINCTRSLPFNVYYLYDIHICKL